MYCGPTGCTADCTPPGRGTCAPGTVCDSFGRCANPDVGDGGPNPIPDGGECPSIHVTLETLVPEVLLLLDQSGSMTDDFGNTDRWTAMTDALVEDPDGAEDAVFYTANDPDELRAAFDDIIGRARSCLLTLRGTLDLTEAADGEVVLNGVALVYDDPNGWRAVDAHTIELVGAACDTFLEADELDLSATFPCGAVLF